jgi:hypothetical protein
VPSTAENALFSARAYEMLPEDQFRQRIGDRWRLFPVDSRLRENPVTGFRARVYHNEAMREVVIAFAGTRLNDWGDWGAIWAMANGHAPQFIDAFELYDRLRKSFDLKSDKTDISFTGHSLGGALAQYMAIAAKGCRAETFGAPGILQALGRLKQYYDTLYSYPVINHVSRHDDVGVHSGQHLGKTIYHAIDVTDGILPLPMIDRFFYNHSMPRYLAEFKRTDGAFVRRKISPSGHVTLEECNWTGQVRRKIKKPPGF